MPRRLKAASRATPPTTGGSTSGSSTRPRTRARPGNGTRASTQASGRPNSTDSAVAPSEHTSDSRSALARIG